MRRRGSAAGLGVAAVTYGAGALNMVNAVAGAYAEKSPVVVISGAPGDGRGAAAGFLLHHQAKTLDSQFRIYRGDHLRPGAARRRRAGARPDRARAAQLPSTDSQPVYLELPRDMVGVACAPVEALRPRRPIRMRSPPAWTRSWRGCARPSRRC